MKFTFLLFLYSAAAMAMSEQTLLTEFPKTALPYFQTRSVPQEFTASDGLHIKYYSFLVPGAKRVLVIAPGQGEPSIKYAEFIYDLKDLGVDIFIIDHRSQGDSGRILTDIEKVHVNHFSDYTSDLAIFSSTVVHPESYEKSVLLGMSMGGAIVADFVRTHPTAYSSLVFLSPMFQVNSKNVSDELALKGLEAMEFEGFGTIYAPSQTAFDPHDPYPGNDVSSSTARFHIRRELLNLKPEYGSGGGTVHWAIESIKKTIELQSAQKLLQVPTLVFQASADSVVVPEAEANVCQNNSRFCQLISLKGAKHELLMERDLFRDPILKSIRRFLLQ